LSREKALLKETRISVERSLDGVKLKLQPPGSNEAIEILLPFEDANRLGRVLVAESRTGMVQMELLVRKIADMEHRIRSLEARLRELERALSQRVEKQGT